MDQVNAKLLINTLELSVPHLMRYAMMAVRCGAGGGGKYGHFGSKKYISIDSN